MPQSLARVLIHLVFSTKNRAPVLSAPLRKQLHPYMAAILESLSSPSLQVGGAQDHVHVLFGISRSQSIAKIVEALKTSSSKWIKTQGKEFEQFHWQSGYGVFSVSQSHADKVVAYIQRQEVHHQQRSFQDEYRRLLECYRVQFDERYVWD